MAHDDRRLPRREADRWFDFSQDLRQMLQTIGAEIQRQDRLREPAKPARAQLHLVKKKSA
jgi:hypothetical protein